MPKIDNVICERPQRQMMGLFDVMISYSEAVMAICLCKESSYLKVCVLKLLTGFLEIKM